MQVIIADHNSKARKALSALLLDQPRIYVTGEAAEANGLLQQVKKRPADVIMLDYRLPGIPMAELITLIRTMKTSPKVIIMSSDPETARLALSAGGDFFISKGNQPEWVLETLYRCERDLEEHRDDDFGRQDG
jgi:DNA-binding NarL/FixJ family response regulator